MAEQLRPEGIPVVIGDVVITTPGLTGEVEVHPAASPGHARRRGLDGGVPRGPERGVGLASS